LSVLPAPQERALSDCAREQCLHRCTSGNAVINHDRGAPSASAAQIALAPPLYLSKLTIGDRFENSFIDIRQPDHILIAHNGGGRLFPIAEDFTCWNLSNSKI